MQVEHLIQTERPGAARNGIPEAPPYVPGAADATRDRAVAEQVASIRAYLTDREPAVLHRPLPDAARHAIHHVIDVLVFPAIPFERDRWRAAAFAAVRAAAPWIRDEHAAGLREHIDADHATLRFLTELHQPDVTDPGFCGECGHSFPCQTARVLDGTIPTTALPVEADAA